MMQKNNGKELFVIVDKHDRVLDYRNRFVCHQNKTLIHRAIHVIIFNKKGALLMQKRSKQKDMQPGFWTVSVGGHVSKGETYTEAAVRETKEELGVKIRLKKIAKYLAEVDDQTEMVTLFSGISNGPFHLNQNEVEEVRFFLKNQLKTIFDKITPLSRITLKKIKWL